MIIEYPGPVIATTTEPDIYNLTSTVRAHLGPVHVFNPQHIGGVPSTFCWSPINGCDPATAIRRADAFAFAVSQKGVEDGSFWSAKASDYLRGYFSTPPPWPATTCALSPHGSPAPIPTSPNGSWPPPTTIRAVTLSELRSEAQKTTATVRMVMSGPWRSWPTPPWPPASCPSPAKASTSRTSCTTSAPCT